MGSYHLQSLGLTMSKTFSALSRFSKTGSKGLGTQHSPQLYFVSDNSQAVLKTGPYLTFKTGGWEEESKKWGLVWSSDRTQQSLPAFRQKQVRVITKSGENLLATSIQ